MKKSEDDLSYLALRLYENKGPNDLDKAENWINKVLSNKKIDERRSGGELCKVSMKEIMGEPPPPTEKLVSLKLYLECVDQELQCMGKQTAIVLRYKMTGESVKDIAEFRGVSVNTVKKLLQEGRKKLRYQCGPKW